MPYFYRKDDDKFCVYKGTSEKPEERIKCHPTAKEAQAHVAALMSATADEEKATLSSGARTSLPDSAFLYIEPGGEKKDGKTVPDSKRHLPYRKADGSIDLPHLRNAISRLSQEATGTGKDSWLTAELRKRLLAKARKLLADNTKSRISIKRRSDGSYRWAAISSVAIRDKEGEIVSEKAYDDAIAFADEVSHFGDIDLVHIDGTSVGECDGMFRLGKLLVEYGTMPDTPRAHGVVKAIESDPDYWGVSIRFLADYDQFDDETKTYLGGIRILNRTILPKWMAASYGTAISVKGGTMKLDKDAMEALRTLLPEEEYEKVVALAQQKSVDPTPNVVEKADEQPETETQEVDKAEGEAPEPTETQKESIWKRLSDLLDRSRKPVEQAEKADESASTEVEALETPPAIEIDYDEVIKRVLAPVRDATTEAVNKQLEPLMPLFQAFADRFDALDAKIAERDAPIEEQIAKRISELPPVVKVSATTKEASPASVEVVGETAPDAPKTPAADLMERIAQSVANAVGSELSKAKIEV